jgi:phosphoribosylformylglycinamidine (FGAM) synthase-like amidotransferase family enzyme
MRTHPCFHKTPGCLWCNLCSDKEEEKGVKTDLLEFQDFDEFEGQASDVPQSAVCGGFVYVDYVSILCALIHIM